MKIAVKYNLHQRPLLYMFSWQVSMYATFLYSKCDQTSDLWQELELASELESDLQDTIEWGRNLLVNFNLLVGKIQLVLFEWYKSNGAIDAKMDGIVLEEKLSFKTLRLTFFSESQNPFKSLLCISINLPCGHAWNTVVIIWPGAPSWYSYLQKRIVGPWLLVLPLLNPWLIVKI